MAHQPLTRLHKLGIKKRVTNFQTRIAKIVDDRIHLGDRERRVGSGIEVVINPLLPPTVQGFEH
ncbi:hypothetical protein NDI37_17960 [Funiculus sociatus GB2-A5]|uniref:Uncharacterized protein n=1 Tax=Funiculus sociatus GB2-A5 TaxID=2933946 RepID=A0ABV0JT08_9CYAN|nr:MULTISPECIES: hypothetical protein [unclassified Trichocoleus]